MKLRPFELTLVVIFGILMVLALVLLRTYKPAPDESEVPIGQVAIWGTLPAAPMQGLIATLRDSNPNFQQVTYRSIKLEDFNQALIQALADGTPPDLMLIPHELLVAVRSRLQPFPAESFSERSLRTSYIDGSEIFLIDGQVYAYPVAVDPLMMYWNRDLFSFVNILQPPTTWEELVNDTVPSLIVRETDRTIRQSAIAFGEGENVQNYLPVLSMLMMQGGSSLVGLNQDKRYEVKLDTAQTGGGRPLSTAAGFYMNFSSESNTLYSWNKSMPLDRELFLTDRLALYFGFASEAKEIEERNPNLNFDVAMVPQGASATAKRTYGTFYGLVVPSAAKNKTGAYSVLNQLTTVASVNRLSDEYQLAPAYRASLTAGTNDTYGRVAYLSASIARGWLNPEPGDTKEVFSQLVDQIKIDRTRVTYAVGDAIRRLEKAY